MVFDGDAPLVTGYLSAVAAALGEHGITVITLRRGEPHPDALSGTLALHPSTACRGHGWGPTEAIWHESTGWSIQFYGGINGHLTTRRYLHTESVPSPTAVAGFIAAAAAGRQIGASAPPQFACNRQELVDQLDRFRGEGCRDHRDPAPSPAVQTRPNDTRKGRRDAPRSADPAPSEGAGAGSSRGGGGDDTRYAHNEEATNATPRPVRIPQQRRATRAKAALARAARRRLREQVTRGELIAATRVRAGAGRAVAKPRIADLLKALPGNDPVATAALLRDVGLHPDRRARGLGRRQRQALLDAIVPGSSVTDRDGSASAGRGRGERRSGRSRHRAPR